MLMSSEGVVALVRYPQPPGAATVFSTPARSKTRMTPPVAMTVNLSVTSRLIVWIRASAGGVVSSLATISVGWRLPRPSASEAHPLT